MLLEVNAQTPANPSPADAAWQFRVVLTEITAYKRAHAQLLDEVADQQERIEAHATRMRLLNQELGQVMKVFLKELHLPLARALNFLALARRTAQEPPVGSTPWPPPSRRCSSCWPLPPPLSAICACAICGFACTRSI
ncbi:hypothetical protein [Deinococcus multiflagellatus]|uniref:Uncharacterized protein n=1 Tax=Deinococcus multiflagellatus TaxID=1656887 RepID=A0ABW1ZLV1_9DEIO